MGGSLFALDKGKEGQRILCPLFPLSMRSSMNKTENKIFLFEWMKHKKYFCRRFFWRQKTSVVLASPKNSQSQRFFFGAFRYELPKVIREKAQNLTNKHGRKGALVGGK